MIKLENTEVVGWEAAIRGMRNPKNSWEKGDSGYCRDFFQTAIGGKMCDEHCPRWSQDSYCGYSEDMVNRPEWDGYMIGSNDHKLMMQLASGGPVHAKYRRMITVYVDITAPLYWWKEFDTYKVGTVVNSCSTMHKIHAKEFTMEDFSCEHLISEYSVCDICTDDYDGPNNPKDVLRLLIDILNEARNLFLETKDKRYWWQMIQLLPSSYNQKRTVMLNYEVLTNIYKSRRDHKLDEWHDFCHWIEGLPYSEIITCDCDANKPEEKSVLSLKDRLVISAYTGVLLCEYVELHKFVEETLGRPVFAHELAMDAVQKELKEKLKPEFMRICGKQD